MKNSKVNPKKLISLAVVAIAIQLVSFASFAQQKGNDALNGLWKSTENNLEVRVFNKGGIVYAKLESFPCSHASKLTMRQHLDDQNPIASLRSRSWLDILVLTGLKLEETNKWSGGQIYSPNDGKTWSASVTLLSDKKLEVRGYWGIEFFGKSMYFNKVQ